MLINIVSQITTFFVNFQFIDFPLFPLEGTYIHQVMEAYDGGDETFPENSNFKKLGEEGHRGQNFVVHSLLGVRFNF